MPLKAFPHLDVDGFDPAAPPVLASESASFVHSASAGPSPSTTSLISDIVFSTDRRRVLGLVFVVPTLACRRCAAPQNAVGDVGVTGEPGDAVDADVPPDDAPPDVASSSSRVVRRSAEGGSVVDPCGVEGLERMTLASSEFASTSSGGRRSFSMSERRLRV